MSDPIPFKCAVCSGRGLVPQGFYNVIPWSDSTTSAELMAVFRDLHGQGQTIVMVTHEHDIAAHAARIVTLRDGLIASDQRQAA